MNWNVFLPTLSFIIFDLCFCRIKQNSFDLAENRTCGGYHTEYSSMKMGFYEYANMFISSTILAILFFGGYNYPGMSWVVNWGVILVIFWDLVLYQIVGIFLYGFVGLFQDLDTIN
jgi:NADH-quinone oxidoreductase subunit H